MSTEIREFLVQQVSKRGGHLGPNLGVVELTLALHRVFHSPSDPIVFDTGHQAYVHKIVTGRADQFDKLRTRGGLSGYPSRAESPHDWIENSHASTSLSYADGLAKAFALRGETERTVVAVIGDGALTGGMAWEALNNIAAGHHRPVVIVLNDNGRSYAPTAGGMAQRMAAMRLRPGYERLLGQVKSTLPKAPVVGRPLYSALHAAKTAVKDWLLPQTMFADLGLKYVGPVDGHDIAALEVALRRARDFRRAGAGALCHPQGPGLSPGRIRRRRTDALAAGVRPGHRQAARRRDHHLDPCVRAGDGAGRCGAPRRGGHHRGDVRADRSDPVRHGVPERVFDVGIAEQHALTSAAGLAMGGMHPVVAVYATFLNRAFDQLLMDCALHRLGVTVVLDRAGVTGEDGPSHHGMWDMSLAAIVPGLQLAAPRDAGTLAEELAEALAVPDGPTVLRFPKGAVPESVPALRRFRLAESTDNGSVASGTRAGPSGVDVLAEPAPWSGP